MIGLVVACGPLDEGGGWVVQGAMKAHATHGQRPYRILASPSNGPLVWTSSVHACSHLYLTAQAAMSSSLVSYPEVMISYRVGETGAPTKVGLTKSRCIKG